MALLFDWATGKNQGSETKKKTRGHWNLIKRKNGRHGSPIEKKRFEVFLSKHRDRGHWVLRSTKTRTLSPMKDRRRWSLIKCKRQKTLKSS